MPIKRIGQDFIVNTTTTSYQIAPSVTALAGGRFVVTWESNDPGDGSFSCIRGRLYQADGTAASNDFIVNTTTTGNQIVPSVTVLGRRPVRGDVGIQRRRRRQRHPASEPALQRQRQPGRQRLHR